MNDNLADLWNRLAQQFGDRPALVAGGREFTWDHTAQRAKYLAGAWAEWGCGPERPVAIMTTNVPAYLEATWAAFLIRASPVNINFRYTPGEVAEVVANSNSAAVIFDEHSAPAVVAAKAGIPHLSLIGVSPTPPGLPPEGSDLSPGAASVLCEDVLAYGSLATGGIDPAPARAGKKRSGDDVFIIYTGGTTGRPKGVCWRHHDLAAWLAYPGWEAAGLRFPVDADDAVHVAVAATRAGLTPITLPACPLVHGTGFFFAIAAWMLGGTVVLSQPASPDWDKLWALVQAYRVTQIALVGDVFARPAAQALDRAARSGSPYDTTSLKRIFSSGLMWSASTKKALHRHTQATLIDMLGSSEGGPFGLDVVEPGQTPGTSRFRATERARIMNPDGSTARVGQAGLLAITEPVPLGYLGDPAASAATFWNVDGHRWAVPGDWAVVDHENRLTLLGRGSSCINTGGEKVFAEEVEEAIKELSFVTDAVVVGIDDPDWGQAIVAMVTTPDTNTAGSTTALVDGAIPPTDIGDRIRAGLRSILAGYKLPRHVVVVPEIIRGPAGKIDRTWANEEAGIRFRDQT
ncbi:MAG: AMP-binding protein [Acidimicrobiales bacterium]